MSRKSASKPDRLQDNQAEFRSSKEKKQMPMPFMQYQEIKRTKTIEDHNIDQEKVISLINHEKSNDFFEVKEACDERLITQISQIFERLSKDIDSSIRENYNPVKLTCTFNVEKYENVAARPTAVYLHEYFPVSSLERYRLRGKITKLILNRIESIQKITENGDDNDLFLKYLKFLDKQKSRGFSAFNFNIPRQLKFDPYY